VKRLAWIAAAAVLFIGTVLVELPASLLLALVWPDDVPVVLEDVRGSLWHGRAMQVRWRGRTLGSLTWTTQPGALLLATLDTELRLSGEANAQARVLRGFRRTRIQDLDATFPADWLQERLADAAMQAQGRIRLSVPSATIDQHRVTALLGEMTWQDAALRGSTRATLGTLRARFALADDQCVHGTIRDGGGPLSANGGFVTDFSSYQADLRLAARDPRIAPAILWLGQADASGGRALHFQRGAPSGKCQAVVVPRDP
jgi:hypothetical protein